MKQFFSRLFVVGVAVFLTACSGTGGKKNEAQSIAVDKVLTAGGQSHFGPDAILGKQQLRSEAEQAAKMNAYRGLAGLLYRERLGDGKTVGGQVMRDESYRVYVDTFLREAKLMDMRSLGNTLQADLALSLTDRFYRCMSGDVPVVRLCLQQDNKLPLTRLGYNLAEARTVNLGCGQADCGDLFHVGGFSRRKSGFDRGLLSAGLYDTEWTFNTTGRLLLNFLLLNGIAD